RERPEDIEPLARSFLAEVAPEMEIAVPPLAPETILLLKQYEWPGNVRELRNAMERALLFCRGEEITPDHLPHEISSSAGGRLPGSGDATVEAPAYTLAEASPSGSFPAFGSEADRTR